MKVAIIGAGHVGKALAKSSIRGGHTVTMSSAHPENAAKAAQSVGAHAANSNVEAVQGADVVIVAVPYDKLGEVFRGLRVHQIRLQGGDASSDSYCYS